MTSSPGRRAAPLRLALAAALLALWLLPATVLADPCEEDGERHGRNPQCSAPEVPLAIVYPAVGIATLAATQGIAVVRRRRRRASQSDA